MKFTDKEINKDTDFISIKLKEYENKLRDAQEELAVKNKNILDVMIDQHSLAAYYDEIKAELSVLADYISELIKIREGEVYSEIINTHSIKHNDFGLRSLISSDLQIIKLNLIRLEIKELYEKSRLISDQFDKRGYTLTNIREILKAELDDRTLTKEYD